MNVALWAEIRRLAESGKTVATGDCPALCTAVTRRSARRWPWQQPPTQTPAKRRHSILDPYHAQIDALIAKYPELSAVRVLEEISKGDEGYRGGISLVRRYLRQIRPGPRAHLPGGALRAGRGHASRLGRLWAGDGRPDVATRLGVGGHLMLQPLRLHRVQSLPNEGGLLPGGGSRAGVLSAAVHGKSSWTI